MGDRIMADIHRRLGLALPLFGVRRFSAAFVLVVFLPKKKSGGKAPHSK
jgi:hypothetical protein